MPPPPSGLPYRYLEISDFRAGIVNRLYNDFTYGGTYYYAQYPGRLNPFSSSAPLGSAASSSGWYALPSGALAPLPFVITPLNSFSSVLSPAPLTSEPWISLGLETFGPFTNLLPKLMPEVLILGVGYQFQTSQPSGAANLVYYPLYQSPIPTASPVLFDSSGRFNYLPSPVPASAFSFAKTAINPNSPYLSAGYPCVAYCLSQYSYSNPVNNATYVWPNPSAPTNAAPGFLWFGSGLLISHQNRVIGLYNQAMPYSFFGTPPVTNESIYYSDPPNSPNFGSQNINVYPEQPSGYGAAGSISAGELCLIKRASGAVILNGDMNNFYATILPGVQGTGGLMGRTAKTPLGLAYMTMNGAYLWQGGDSATKLSSSLGDVFWVPHDYYSYSWDMPNVDIAYWRNFICVSGGYFYDTITNSWWTINTNGISGIHPPMWYAPSYDGQVIYAVSSTLYDQVNHYTPYMISIGNTPPNSPNTWTSNPIRFPQQAPNRQVLIREILIDLDIVNSSSFPSQTLTVSLLSRGTASSPVKSNVLIEGENVSGTGRLRLPVNLLVTAPQIQIQGNTVISRIIIGYEETTEYAAFSLG